MVATAWGEAENYMAFFFTTLHAEEDMLAKVLSSYGSGLPDLQISHYMMDMQHGYAGAKEPYYAFAIQLDRMQTLHRNHAGRMFSFSAFDPRREDWKVRAEDAIRKGFVGFKFYPAMGYTPSGHRPQSEQDRIDAFFDFCVDGDIPIFTHCTPVGFENRHKLGRNANPALWEKVLKERPALRLCFGHAGGGRVTRNKITFPGWAATDEEWGAGDETNYAKIVARLCKQYPNVYCEVGYITSLLDDRPSRDRFLANLKSAQKLPGKLDLMEKMAFGSDWHMPSMVDNTRNYFDVFLEIFQSAPYSKYIENFFWKNAYSYLKL
jgi:predicted TIM-barrel fold metal-dependent hydrolase